MSAYSVALLDWLGCATRGAREPAARAAGALGDGVHERVVAAGTAGHVLDYDDTYLPGLSHLSAPSAPAALVLGAELGRSVGEVLDAFAAGFEAMGAVARASHPALYDGGWHPTAVCGVVGAAVAASRVLGLDAERERAAVAIALLRASGLRSAFGSDGKALQVGMAAGAGVTAARLAEAGAAVDLHTVARGEAGFEAAFAGARFAEPGDGERAIEQNWIKAWPCCLQTHGAIEAAERATGERSGGGSDPPPTAGEGQTLPPRGETVVVAVHPVSLKAARYGPEPANGLQAKFSIPYCTAFTLLRGAPGVESFARVDEEVVAFAREHVEVATDASLLESEAVLRADGREVRVEAALGSPGQPMDQAALAAKLHDLAGDRLEGALDDPGRPAAGLLEAAGLR